MLQMKETGVPYLSEVLLPKRKESVIINSFDALKTHLDERSLRFFYALADLAENLHIPERRNPGWQTFVKIGRYPLAKVNEKYGTSGVHTFFTGEYLCAIASVAGKDALSRIAPQMEFHVIEAFVDKKAEKWKDPKYETDENQHMLILAEDRSKGQRRLIDLTYPQINHRYTGKVLMIDSEDALKFYRGELGKLISGGRSLPRVDLSLIGLERFGFKQADYKKLVQTLL